MDLSLIIPAYNEEKIIEETLQSVIKAKDYFQNTTNSEMEIIVVHNDSVDNTADICKKYDVRIVNEKIHNIAKVRNTGAFHAEGKFLCFLDADSKVSKNIFVLINKYMNRGRYVGGGTKFKLDKVNLTFSLIFIGLVLATHIIGTKK